MNIFYLHTNPKTCAKWHTDKHVVKMLSETCQILYTVHWICSAGEPPLNIDTAPLTKDGTKRGYKATHVKHPSVLWAAKSIQHYIWLTKLGLELAREYRFRYGKDRKHACEPHLLWLIHNTPSLSDYGWSDPTPAMPDEFKIGKDSISAYREFYKVHKLGLKRMIYSKRPNPFL